MFVAGRLPPTLVGQRFRLPQINYPYRGNPITRLSTANILLLLVLVSRWMISLSCFLSYCNRSSTLQNENMSSTTCFFSWSVIALMKDFTTCGTSGNSKDGVSTKGSDIIAGLHSCYQPFSCRFRYQKQIISNWEKKDSLFSTMPDNYLHWQSWQLGRNEIRPLPDFYCNLYPSFPFFVRNNLFARYKFVKNNLFSRYRFVKST